MQLGYLDIIHFDRAILDCLGGDFLPNEKAEQVGPNYSPDPDALGFGIDGRDAGDDPSCAAVRFQRQVDVPGVTGTGTGGRVAVVWDYPEDAFNEHVVPGIRVSRTGIDSDTQRLVGKFSGRKYRVPSNNGDPVDVTLPNGTVVSGHTQYVHREHAEPMIFTYDIEVRSRYQLEVQELRKYVASALRDRSFLIVRDSIGEISHFTIWRESIQSMSDYVDSLNRYHSYVMSYRVQAQIDDFEETEVRAVTSLPILRSRHPKDPL